MNNFTRAMATSILMMFAALGALAVDHLTIIGSATPGNWSINDGLLMVQDPENENVFLYTGYLNSEGTFKFTSGNDFSDPDKEYRNESSTPTDISKLVQGGDNDYQFQVTESANYNVVCNLSDMTISVSKAEYQENPIRFNALYLVGSATVGDWDIAKATPMVWGGENTPFKFTVTSELNAGEFKIDTNPYTGAWDCPWFFAGVGENGTTDYDKISSDGTDDRKWQIAAAGEYDIDIDLLDNTISIAHHISAGIAEVNIDNHATPIYYNLQGMVVSNPENGIFIKKIGNKVSKVIL